MQFMWSIFVRGMIMGITEVIPGISSSTIAMILGIYERFIDALSKLTTKQWKQQMSFLIPLGCGIVLSMMLLVRIIQWLLNHYEQPTMFFFLGLILSVVPFLLKKIEYQHTFERRHYGVLVIVTALVASFGFMRGNEHIIMTDLTFNGYVFLFWAGWLASSAMILPGISGAFVFLLVGAYPTVLNALSNVQVTIIAVVGAGIVCGILFTSKMIKFFLERYPVLTYALMIGLILGSTVSVFPGMPATFSLGIASVLAFIAGLFITVLLRRVTHS